MKACFAERLAAFRSALQSQACEQVTGNFWQFQVNSNEKLKQILTLYKSSSPDDSNKTSSSTDTYNRLYMQ